MMMHFEGVDWTTFVRKRNKDRYNLADAELIGKLKNEDNLLLDEIEEDKEEVGDQGNTSDISSQADQNEDKP